MGACDGGGGDHDWKMDVRGVNRIVEVAIWHGGAVDACDALQSSLCFFSDSRQTPHRNDGKDAHQTSHARKNMHAMRVDLITNGYIAIVYNRSQKKHIYNNDSNEPRSK